jgi:hypothetical protein
MSKQRLENTADVVIANNLEDIALDIMGIRLGVDLYHLKQSERELITILSGLVSNPANTNTIKQNIHLAYELLEGVMEERKRCHSIKQNGA